MEISKEEIQRLIDAKGKKWLRMIYDRYKDLFLSNLPATTIAMRISEDLERPIDSKQIYNIRTLYQESANKKKRKVPLSPTPVKAVESKPEPKVEPKPEPLPAVEAKKASVSGEPKTGKPSLESFRKDLDRKLEEKEDLKRKRLGLTDNDNK